MHSLALASYLQSDAFPNTPVFWNSLFKIDKNNIVFPIWHACKSHGVCSETQYFSEDERDLARFMNSNR